MTYFFKALYFTRLFCLLFINPEFKFFLKFKNIKLTQNVIKKMKFEYLNNFNQHNNEKRIKKFIKRFAIISISV